MRLFVPLGFLLIASGESVPDIGKDNESGTPGPVSGNDAGSIGLTEQQTKTSKGQDQPNTTDKRIKVGVRTEESKGGAAIDDIFYSSVSTDKNGLPVTRIQNLEKGLEVKTNPVNSVNNADESTEDLSGKESKSAEEMASLINDDNIHELSASLEEERVIHENGSEEIDSAGIIHGKYTYTLERDGIPTTIEYEVSPETGFVVTNFYKQNRVQYEENSNLKLEDNVPSNSAIPKTITIDDLLQPSVKIVDLEKKVPNYEHSTVLAKYKPRVRRSDDSNILVTPDSTIRSPSPPGEDLENPVLEIFDYENTPDKVKVTNPKEQSPAFDASYKFGFAVADQARNEESDAKGNVIGSYSYIDYDGLMTKVEYEAGANKGFVVKKISHEQRKPLKHKEITDRVNSKVSSELQQDTEAGINEEKAERYSDEGFFNISPEVKGVPDTNTENQRMDLENEKYSSQGKNFSMYGLPTEEYINPPVDLEIRRAIAISDKNNKEDIKRNGKVRKMVMRRPRKPNGYNNFMSINPDGSYEFQYQTNDHSRRESVDSLGNVHSSYQQSTKRDGTTIVVFERQGVNKGTITNKKTHVNNNVQDPSVLREVLVNDDTSFNQTPEMPSVPKLHTKRSWKNTNGVANYVMHRSRA